MLLDSGVISMVCPGRFWGVYEQLCLISKIQLGKVGPGVGAKKKI